MRIDIGPEGRIVGTKRVSTNGQVGGLGSYAGKDVLVLVPAGRPSFSFSARDYLHEWQQTAQKNAKRVAKELRSIQKRIPTSEEIVARARKELSLKGLKARLPEANLVDVAQARKLVEKRILAIRRRKDVRSAEKWVRARLALVDRRLRPAAN